MGSTVHVLTVISRTRHVMTCLLSQLHLPQLQENLAC